MKSRDYTNVSNSKRNFVCRHQGNIKSKHSSGPSPRDKGERSRYLSSKLRSRGETVGICARHGQKTGVMAEGQDFFSAVSLRVSSTSLVRLPFHSTDTYFSTSVHHHHQIICPCCFLREMRDFVLKRTRRWGGGRQVGRRAQTVSRMLIGWYHSGAAYTEVNYGS